MNNYENLKEDIQEIKSAVKEIQDIVTSLRVEIPSTYVTKEQFSKLEVQNDQSHNNFTNYIMGIFGFIVTVSASFLAYIEFKLK